MRILAFIALLLSLVGFAQKPEVVWSDELVNPSRTSIHKFLGIIGDNLFVCRTHGGYGKTDEIILEKYTIHGLNLAESIPLDFIPLNEDYQFEEILPFQEDFVVFYSNYDKELETNFAYAQKVSINGSKIGSAIQLDQITAAKKNNAGRFDFVLSKDSNQILVFRSEPFNKFLNEKFAYKLLDKNLKTLWQQEVELPYIDKLFTISNYQLDSDGNVYMLATLYPDKNNGERRARGVPNNKYIILVYYHKENELKEFEIQLENKWISELTFKLDQNDNLVLGGFYSNNSFFDLHGTFYMVIEKETKKAVTQNLKPFSLEFLSQFLKERKIDRGEGLSDFYFNNFHLNKDGSAVLIAEQNYTQQVCYTDPYSGRVSCNLHHYFNDIIAVKVNDKGEILWNVKVPKYQHSVNDYGYYASYAFAVSSSNVYLIYNDNARNAKLTSKAATPFAMTNVKKAVTFMTSIDSDGNVQKEILFPSRGESTIIKPRTFLQASDKELILYGRKGKNYKIGKLTFK